MHIPNGFLDPKVSAGCAFAAASALGYCIARLKQALSAAVPEAVYAGVGQTVSTLRSGIKSAAENHFTKMGAIGGLIFAAQMFNFPVASGTSGHLIGGVLAAIVLGPFSGAIVIATVLGVQSIFFADGGLMALGANILNMSVVGTFAAYYIYYVIQKIIKNRFGYYAGVGFASFFSVLLASVFCAFEIGLSGTISIDRVLPAMASIHSVIGIYETFLTIIGLGILGSIGLELSGIVKNEE